MKRHSSDWNMERVSFMPNTMKMPSSRENIRGCGGRGEMKLFAWFGCEPERDFRRKRIF